MRIEVYRELAGQLEEEWNRFLDAAAHEHPRQRPRFALVEKAVGHDVLYAIGRDDSGIRACALVCLRNPSWGGHADAAALSGPVCDDLASFEAFLRGLVRAPELQKIGRLQISPYWLDDEARQIKTVLDRLGWRSAESEDFRHTGLIDIRKTDDGLLEHFGKSARRKVRLAQRNNFTVRAMTGTDDCKVLYDSLNRLRARNNLVEIEAADAAAHFAHIYSDPRLGIALGAFHGDIFLGGLLVYRSRHSAHARHFTSEPETLKEFSNLRIAPQLWWEGMRWARDQGCTWLDVEGYRADVVEGDPRYNIYVYKGEFHPAPAVRISEHYFTVNSLRAAPAQVRKTIRSALKRAASYRRSQRLPDRKHDE